MAPRVTAKDDKPTFRPAMPRRSVQSNVRLEVRASHDFHSSHAVLQEYQLLALWTIMQNLGDRTRPINRA